MLIDRRRPPRHRRPRDGRWRRSVADVDVPRSIQGLISARLDGLPDEEKSVLQDAAVVGREFWLGAVVRLSGQPPGVIREVLGRLRIKELIVPHEPSSFSRRARVLVPPSADPRRRVRLAAEGPARRASTRRVARVGRRASRRPSRRDGAADRVPSPGGAPATWRSSATRVRRGTRPSSPRTAGRGCAGDRATALWLQSDAIVLVRARRCALADAVGAPLAERLAIARLHTEACFASASTTENEVVVSSVPRPGRGSRRRARGGMGAGGAGRGSCSTRAGDQETQELSDAAVRRLEPLGDSRELAFALNVAGWYRWRRGRYEEAEPLLRRAVEIAERVGARRELAEADDGPRDHARHTSASSRSRSTRSRRRTPWRWRSGHAVVSAGSTTTTRRSPGAPTTRVERSRSSAKGSR